MSGRANSGRPNVRQAINHRATVLPGYCPIFIYLFYLFGTLEYFIDYLHRLTNEVKKKLKEKLNFNI